MRFDLSEGQALWREKAQALAADLVYDAAAGDAIMGAVRHGLLHARTDLLSHVAAVEALAAASPSAAAAYAVHAVVCVALRDHAPLADQLLRGEAIGAASLSAEDVPMNRDGRLSGRASWVMPVTDRGVALVGARLGDEAVVFAVSLQARGVTVVPVQCAGLHGVRWAHLELDDAEAIRQGPTVPMMARARVLMAAVGLGMGARALAEALAAARAGSGTDAGEQTVRGLLADAATELDAARLLAWKAAACDGALSFGDASIAKLAATGAAQGAVARATQVVGAESFCRGHILERLAKDVRALELFAGRTEALRGAYAAEHYP